MSFTNKCCNPTKSKNFLFRFLLSDTHVHAHTHTPSIQAEEIEVLLHRQGDLSLNLTTHIKKSGCEGEGEKAGCGMNE